MLYLSIVFLALIGQWAPVEGFTYMAVVPNSIRPNSELVIPVKLSKRVYGEMVTVQMFELNKKEVLAQQTELVNGQSDVTISLQVPADIPSGSYRVNITGTGSLPFKNSTVVYGSFKSVSLFIQTDKAIYKPGDLVHYRVFAVNGSLSSVTPNLDIEIFDPKGNKIDEMINVDPGRDLSVSGDLSLSNNPPLGFWRIDAKAPSLGENARQSYSFEVKEYVLPKFEITVTLSSPILMDSASVDGTIKAIYVFGKPVQGTVSLNIKRKYGYGFFAIASARTELSIDGEASFSIPKEIFERLSQNLEYDTFVLEANVTETITGITLLGSEDVRFQRQTYQLEFYPNMADNYKPGFNTYKIWVKVTDREGNPPVGVTKRVKFDITYFFDQKVTQSIPNNLTFADFEMLSPFVPGETVLLQTKRKALDIDGSVKFSIEIPEGTATLSIKASYGKQSVVKQVSRFRSPGEAYLKITMPGLDPLKIGDQVSIKVKSNQVSKKAHYVVISKDLITGEGTVDIDAQGKGSLILTVTRDMMTSARIVIYFVADNGEIVADGHNFVVDDIFENKVTISFDKAQAEPGNKATLKVQAAVGSFVSVLAVDKSVRLMKQGNDITKDRVSDELRRYGYNPWLPATAKWGKILPWTFTADDASDIFNYARLTVLTDGHLPVFNLYSLMRRGKAVSRAFSSNVEMDSVAFRGVAGGSTEPTTRIRREFPETWIWITKQTTNGEAVFPDLVVPDTITTFVGSAFALDSDAGLGVAESTANLTVIKPFFISFQPPYSVVRGETAVLQANIFNYSPVDLNVAVTLRGSPDFVTVTIGPNGKEVDASGDQVKCVPVKSNRATPVFYNIKPTKLGRPKILVEAMAQTASRTYSDAVEKELRVKAEGQEKEDNIPILISLKKIGEIVSTYNWPIDGKEIVPDSERCRVTLIGDIFGPTFKNLDRLIKLPYGCGEQNMLNFAPSVFTAVYMNTTGRFDSDTELQQKIKTALNTGYQRQLIYQRRDGSFSAFGNADEEGSVWLTAFVLKCFAQAKKLNLNYMDPKVVERALSYILFRQLPDGRFESTGTVHHRAMQGGSVSSNRTFTAFVTIALYAVKESGFLDNNKLLYDTLVKQLAVSDDYLDSSVGNMGNDYERAICAYALKLAKKPGSSTLLTALEKTQKKNEIDNIVYWENDYHTLKIETASYVLMTFTLNSATDKGFPILKWLISNRGPFGGYASTQDTVLAIQATSEYAALVYSKDVDMTIAIKPTVDNVVKPSISLTLTPQNQDVLQFREIGKFDNVTITASGKGLAMLELNIFYNVFKDKKSSYIVTLKTTSPPTDKNSYVLEACAKYNIPNRQSNMAIMDIGVVSGFEAEKDKVEKKGLIKRIESASGRLIIYFDEIPSKEVCVKVPVQRVSLVSKVLPANVIVYSYYYPDEREMKSYLPANLQSSELCTICGTACGCGPVTNILPVGQCTSNVGYK